MNFVRASHSLNNLTEGALSRRWRSALRLCKFKIRNRNRPRSPVEILCRVRPLSGRRAPFLRISAREQIGAKARCPLHGDRFAPMFRIYVPKCHRDNAKKFRWWGKEKNGPFTPKLRAQMGLAAALLTRIVRQYLVIVAEVKRGSRIAQGPGLEWITEDRAEFSGGTSPEIISCARDRTTT